MTCLEIITPLHVGTRRDYLERVTQYPKAEAAALAKKWDFEYWDGDRITGYGGYHYDGRWKPVAEKLACHYGLEAGDAVLDVGCGKGFLLFDLAQAVPGLRTYGIDVSWYALDHAHGEVRSCLASSTATALPFSNGSFDLVVSLNVLHNLHTWELRGALAEIQRVGQGRGFVVVESYRTEQEKANLLYWQLTCEQFCTPKEWEWWFDLAGYSGDYEFIYFD